MFSSLTRIHISWMLACLLLMLMCRVKLMSASARPSVEELCLDYRYNQQVESLRAIDFRNFAFHLFDEDKKPWLVACLRGGKFERPWTLETGSDWVRLDWVKFLDGPSEYAVIGLSWVETGGSSSDYGVVQLLALQNKHPVLVQQITFNTRSCVRIAGAKFAPSTKVLIVKGVHGWEHCCPNKLDVLTYTWSGSGFKREGSRSVAFPPGCQ